jgi:hypothetical protein
MHLPAMFREIAMLNPTTSGVPMYKRLIVLSFALATATPGFPSPAQAHDGRLDQFGCHQDQDQKYYHCHDGPYKRLSFDSQTQMIQRLRNQYIALGRTWPYADATDTTEQAGPIVETTLEPEAVPFTVIKEARSVNRLKSNESEQRIARKEVAKPTDRQTSQMHQKTEAATAKKAAPKSEVRRKRTEPELKVWVTQIRADGRPVFQSREGERFFLDDSGNKVLIERRES